MTEHPSLVGCFYRKVLPVWPGLFLSLLKALFVKIVVFKTKRFKVDWSGSARLLREQRDR
jgi:hypothetical protein